MQAISVFCGSSNGNQSIFSEQARLLGCTLAQRDITVIYGGAKVGLMGAVADGALQEGGKVIGILPHFLSNVEIAHPALTELIIVNSMHERKQRINDLCTGAIALPGGFGTLDELFDMLTLGQLGIHQKPIGTLNTNGYYDGLLQLLQNMVANGLLRASNYAMVLADQTIEGLLQKMAAYQPPLETKWIPPAK